MPHIFHMAFAENTESYHLRTASWGLPLYLMLLSLPVLPVTWAGIRLGHTLPIDYTGLALGLEAGSTFISSMAFVAGLSAASATIIVTTLALANMCLNHLILPVRLLQIDREQNIYGQLKWLRRTFIGALILAGYGFFKALSGSQTLTQLGLVAFSGTLQFLPGVLATLYWPAANRKGLLAGLAGACACGSSPCCCRWRGTTPSPPRAPGANCCWAAATAAGPMPSSIPWRSTAPCWCWYRC